MAKLSYKTVTDDELKNINEQLAKKDAIDILKWAYSHFGEDIVYACSFGAEGIVLIDLISKVNKNATIVFLDTELHFEETYALIEKVKAKYPTLNIELKKPELTVAEQNEQYGNELWKSSPDQCCKIRKLKPLEEELSKYQAWISGLRREQSETRAHVQFVNRDNRFQSIKVCPLIHWSWDEIWMYIKLHQLPYNELHDQNYPSIGCANCTLPVADGRDTRAGRWANSGKVECGLHQ
ncbi:phosphoadenosine phosphosulfate reductase [Anaerobacillus alkalilacustris]|uniref:Adenosine 5'-phosphosulfate reductase n=1 Tax=Anaerobacillus alkalilacustris TaxID=393763 RepID=A0A1S2LJ37_9BACI|nr:phosphoadenylyl-sulfate reductase [Anaerobacillus alkalilacustris]OIJ12538.1 phosphoadenosine phosphosulfate reductase [Anaerobacillus alkalilacustris]